MTRVANDRTLIQIQIWMDYSNIQIQICLDNSQWCRGFRCKSYHMASYSLGKVEVKRDGTRFKMAKSEEEEKEKKNQKE